MSTKTYIAKAAVTEQAKQGAELMRALTAEGNALYKQFLSDYEKLNVRYKEIQARTARTIVENNGDKYDPDETIYLVDTCFMEHGTIFVIAKSSDAADQLALLEGLAAPAGKLN